jgi:hypothetical protein
LFTGGRRVQEGQNKIQAICNGKLTPSAMALQGREKCRQRKNNGYQWKTNAKNNAKNNGNNENTGAQLCPVVTPEDRRLRRMRLDAQLKSLHFLGSFCQTGGADAAATQASPEITAFSGFVLFAW